MDISSVIGAKPDINAWAGPTRIIGHGQLSLAALDWRGRVAPGPPPNELIASAHLPVRRGQWRSQQGNELFAFTQEDFRPFVRRIMAVHESQELQKQQGARLAAVSLDATAPKLLDALNRKTSIRWGDLPNVVEGEWEDVLRSVVLLSGANLCEASPTRLRLSEHGERLLADGPTSTSGDADLSDAIGDLREVIDEAREEGTPLPSNAALESAERLLREMYRISPRRFEVYPTPDGEVAIDAPSRGCSVLLLCDSDGGALCLVNVDGAHRRARYSTTRTLPDGFVREALVELEQHDD